MSNVEQGIMKFEVGGSVNKDYKFELQDRLVGFAVPVISVVESLPDSRAGKHIASQ